MEELDLHGVRHEDVRGLVIRFIEDNWGMGQPVKIITGHSMTMAELVFNVVAEYNVPFGQRSYYAPFGLKDPSLYDTYTIVGLDKT